MRKPQRTSYESVEWSHRQLFMQLVASVCRAEGVALSWSSENWIATLQKNGVTRRIYGYTFPFNDAATASLMRDKPAMYAMLTQAGVPAIPHFLLRLPASRDTTGAATAAQALAPLPLVVKPHTGARGGFDVVRCETPAQLAATLRELATRHQTLAVSPYVPFVCELRVVMLHGEPLLVFGKTRAPGEWRHNLALGATPTLVSDPAVIRGLAAIARRSMQATGAQLAAVDIADTPDGYKIMELNGGISLASFAAHSPAYANAAREAYSALIKTLYT